MTNHLEYYKVFYYVAKYRSLTAAAEQLAISQPAVSQAVKMLENGVGTKLFIRTSRGVRLTAEGEILARYVSKGYEQIELGEKKLAQMLDLEIGELRIGASDMTLRFYLLPYLEQFHEQYPGIKVTVSNAPTPETLDSLLEGKIDFGVVSTPFDVAPGIEAVRVKEIEDIFIGGLKLRSYKNRMLDLQEVERLPIISLEKKTSTRKFMDAFLEENGVELNPEFELATSDMIVQFTLRNMGIGCIMREFAEEYLETGRLFALRFNKIIPRRHFCIVTDEKNPLSAAGRKLLDLISEEGGRAGGLARKEVKKENDKDGYF